VVEQNEFHFDHAFPSTVGQDEMYLALILPLVEKALQGFQCTALAYGQTGTGKSYSMGMAPPDKVGSSSLLIAALDFPNRSIFFGEIIIVSVSQ